MEGSEGFDLLAASLRADRDDMSAFVAALAARLEGALPGRCAVRRRRRSPLSRETRVERVEVELGERRFLLHWQARELVAEVEAAVHDMRRRRDRVGIDQWLSALEAELRRQASSSADARAALERLLHS